MKRIQRLPLPESCTVDVAVQHLYIALSNKGKARLRHIELIHPHMVDALYSLWQAEYPYENRTERESVCSLSVRQEFSPGRGDTVTVSPLPGLLVY